MTLEEFNRIYEKLEDAISQGGTGLRTPGKMTGELPTKNAIVLTYLFERIGTPVTKGELTAAVRFFYPDTNDVQQARHLATQSGFWINSGTRGDSGDALAADQYMLVSLTEIYPGYTNRRAKAGTNFEEIKSAAGNRCATCGSSQGEPNFLNPSVTTSLQEGHMDPRKGLEIENVIPQCQVCNRAYRDWFIFYPNGRVRTINPSSPRWLGIEDTLDSNTWENLVDEN